jgi:hypothetical protein
MMSAPSAQDGSFTINLLSNTTVHMAATAIATTVPTINSETLTVGTVAIMGFPVHAMKRENSVPAAVATAAGITVDQLVSQGACQWEALFNYTPPTIRGNDSATVAVTESGYTVYGITFAASGAVTAAVTNGPVPQGRFCITKAGLTQPTTVHIQITDTSTATGHPKVYPPLSCYIVPGRISFQPGYYQ